MEQDYQKNIKKNILLFLVLLLFFLMVLLVSFSHYLFTLQRMERLAKLDHYSDYVLTSLEQKQCQTKESFTFDGVTYVYDCLDEIYLSYGSTKATLKEMITLGYLDLSEFLSTWESIPHEEEEDVKEYSYESMKDHKKYDLKLFYLSDTLTKVMIQLRSF